MWRVSIAVFEEKDLQPKFISSEIYRATGYTGNHPLAIQRIGAVLTLCEQLGWLGRVRG